MYYGYYSNYTFIKNCSNAGNQGSCGIHLSYNMPLAYFFTIGMAFFITCIILVYRSEQNQIYTPVPNAVYYVSVKNRIQVYFYLTTS